MEEYKCIAELNFEKEIEEEPIKDYIVVSENGVKIDNEDLFCDSLIVGVLVDSNSINALLKKIGVPGNEIKNLGIPFLNFPEDKNIFVNNRFKKINSKEIEFFSVQRESPFGELILNVTQEFELYYNLETRKEKNSIYYDDNTRRVKDVIIIEDIKEESIGKSLKTMRIRKQYLLDFISIKKKAFLIGYYSFKRFKDVDPDITKEIKQKRIDGRILDKTKLWLYIDNNSTFGDNSLVSRWDMYKLILPNKKYIFSHNAFGVSDSKKIDIKLMTWDGEINPKLFREFKRKEGSVHFMSQVFFNEDVLTKYEKDRSYTISDNGAVGYSYQWGIFRGIQRLANKYIQLNVGDFAEGIIESEWPYWASHNINPPPSLEEVKQLRIIPTVQQRVNLLFKRIEEFNIVFQKSSILNSFLLPIPSLIKKSHNFDEDVIYLKRTIFDGSEIRELLNRCNVLSMRLIDEIDINILSKIVSKFDRNAIKNDVGERLGSLKLLTTLIILIKFTKEQIEMGEQLSDAKNNAYSLYKKIMDYKKGKNSPKDQDEQSLIEAKLNEIELVFEKANIMFVIYSLRNKGGAHPPSKKEIESNLKEIGYDNYNNKTLDIYRKILDELSKFYNYLIQELI